MSKSTLEKLRILSPLAAAIAFAVALPSQLLAAKFDVGSQADLDDAVDAINSDGEGTHTITFNSSVSGEHLTLNEIDLYGEGSLVIDGAGAKNLTLGVLEKNNTDNAIELYDDASLTLKNLTIIEGANASSGYVVSAQNSYGELTITNVHISGVALGSTYEAAGVIEAEGLTITDSSFTNLSGNDIIDIRHYENSVETETKITNTQFSGNYAGKLIDIYNGYYGTELSTVVISGISVDDNELTSDVIQIDTGAYLAGDRAIEVSILNSSFTNNKADSVIDAGAHGGWGSSNSDASLTLNLANITVANNIIDSDAVYVESWDYGHSEGEGSVSSSINMAHATIVNNGGDVDDEGEGYFGGGGFVFESYTEGDDQVNIVNSIISGNSFIEAEYASRGLEAPAEMEAPELTVVKADFYSSILANVDNTLVGVEYLEEGESESKMTGEGNIEGEDPKLGELTLDKDTGTMVMKPLKGSPVINAGTDEFNEEVADILGVKTAELIDQIGNKRTVGAKPDMGAVEKAKKKSDSGLFGSLGLGSVLATFGLLGLRRKRK